MSLTSTEAKKAGEIGGDLLALPGFSAVPPKLMKRIVDKQYIDMWELLPETWVLETESSCCHSKRPRRAMVADINVWTECYATLAAILSAAYPEKAPHLFAYLRTITKASRTFDNTAWASYDMAYRRQAANRGSLDWGYVDPALYNEAFAGRAKLLSRCRYCLADTHNSTECPSAPAGSPTGTTEAGPAPHRRTAGGTSSRDRSASVEICRLYNAVGGSRCRYQQCRYAHLCMKCKGSHPSAECDRRRPTPSTQQQQGQSPMTSA